MGALDPAKVLVILVIALIVLGPERLPKVARQAGGIWRELTRVREQVVSELREAIPDDLPRRSDLPHFPTPAPGAVSGFVSSLVGTGAASSTRSEIDFEEFEPSTSAALTEPLTTPGETRHLSLVVVHPELGDFAFVPDDPSMN